MEDSLKAYSPEDRTGESHEEIIGAGAELEQASQPFVGRWNELVSTTNWEKGRIIGQWRQALMDAGAPATEYSDEAWARRVGGVSSQHVGRLRRVFERFGETYETYPTLYWSHFFAALDWDDAELWLEGAMRSGWSVSNMRRQRWEAMGAAADQEPQEADIVVAEVDEDFQPAAEKEPDSAAQRLSGEMTEVQGAPIPEGPDFGEESPSGSDGEVSTLPNDSTEAAPELVRPFENLSDLPNDLAEAFDAFKLAILRHKAERWQQISLEDVLAALDSLKQLAVAPTAD